MYLPDAEWRRNGSMSGIPGLIPHPALPDLPRSNTDMLVGGDFPENTQQ